MPSTDVKEETTLPQPRTDKIWVCLAWRDGDNMTGMGWGEKNVGMRQNRFHRESL